ncbi:hypothetical protein SAMN05443529_107173 [Desulfosporosinus hippei DSM 8344]|uniref:Uncharacterized protein n=1 Tax=Desulfosporosinus hippei DSM 8344 TaxID=1121419 RepID=A0A1G7Y2C9_9FIRM|nr:hypothetical protein SAMN05443529_107173 [Desulfosporosinus hippei DSM 8344]
MANLLTLIFSEVQSVFDEDELLEPTEMCGCGDIGYLTARTIPIDLAHGVGRVNNVPVYHCRNTSCPEFRLPSVVSRRLEVIAEQMEEDLSTESVYTWETLQQPISNPLPESGVTTDHHPNNQIPLQAFTLQFVNRQYEDAKVVQIVPGEAVFFKSKLEDTEYYLLRYDEDPHSAGFSFSLLKFYYDDPNFTYENYLEWLEDGHLKELGRISLDDVETTLIDEFGAELY